MSTGLLDPRCRRTLEDIVYTSQRICLYAHSRDNNGDVLAIGNFRTEIELVRRSAETIYDAFTLQNHNLAENLFTWICRGGLLECFDKLKDIEGMLALNHRTQPPAAVTLPQSLGLAEDSITRAVTFFNQHKASFRFLLDQKFLDYAALNQSSTTLENSRSTDEVHNDMEESTMASIAVVAHKQFILQKLDEVVQWLTALDCTEKHVETLQLRQLGTCTWFPKTGYYEVWRTGKSTFLWMRGQAGCGKSVTVASTLEHLKTTLGPGEVLVYFYCDFRNKRSRSATEVMRALLSQLFRHLRTFRVDPGGLPNSILKQKSEWGALLLDDLDRLANWVCRAACRFSHKPLIVVDALDECGNIPELLDALTMLIEADAVRLLVTSRPDEIIRQCLGRYPSLPFQEMDKELTHDIDLHITRELDSYAELRFANAEVRNEIRTKLCRQAEGRFHWVQCQLNTLKQCSSKQEVQQVLDNLPNGLGATYERILGKIDERRLEGRVARRTLAWLLVALAPLRLVQLVEGLVLDTQQRRSDRETHFIGHALVDALSSLVTHNKATDEIALSHYAVKEYLTSRTALPMYRIIPHEAHAEVAQMCMLFITTFLQKWRFRAKAALLKSFPLLHYVFAVGFDHLAHIHPGSTTILDMLQSFTSDVQHHPSHWDLLCELREEDPGRLYPPWPSSRHDLVLFILIAYSSSGLLRSFLQSRPLAPRVGTNPLVYAADLCKTAHGLMLLESGANVNELGLVVDDSRHASPLEVAVDLGNDVLVNNLLQKGSMVPLTLISTAVYTPWCTARVLVHLMHTDVFAEWACKLENEDLYRRVFNSARPNAGDPGQLERDHVALAQRLRSVGQNLAPDSPLGVVLIKRTLQAGNALMLEYLLPPDQPPAGRFLLFACAGNTSETVSMVCLLLRKGVDVRAVSRGARDTALHLAARCPWEPRALELTKILLDAGCNPTAQNRRGETPMNIAVRRRYFTVMKHLPLPSTSIPSYVLYHAIRKRMNPLTIQFLICRGIDNLENARTPDGNTPLHLILMDRCSVNTEVTEMAQGEAWHNLISQASLPGDYHEGQCLELCKILIEAGCDPTSSGARGISVLELAINHGYSSVVKYLLSLDVPAPPPWIILVALQSGSTKIVELLLNCVNVHSRTGKEDSVLHLAITMFQEPECLHLVKAFIKAGCDPTPSNVKGISALELAAKRGYSSVVEYLLPCDVPAPPEVMLVALQSHSIKTVELLLLKPEGAKIHSRTDSASVLYLAITMFQELECLHLVKAFIKAGCDPTSSNVKGISTLELAVKCGYSLVVEYLLSWDVPTPPGIILMALQSCSIKTVELLLLKGANIHSRTDSDSVLHLAVTMFQEPECLCLVKAFIKAGHDPTSSNVEGMSALELAVKRGYSSVVEYLLSPDIHTPLKTQIALRQLLLEGENIRSGTDLSTILSALEIIIIVVSVLCMY